jgi:hypothetical protein
MPRGRLKCGFSFRDDGMGPRSKRAQLPWVEPASEAQEKGPLQDSDVLVLRVPVGRRHKCVAQPNADGIEAAGSF